MKGIVRENSKKKKISYIIKLNVNERIQKLLDWKVGVDCSLRRFRTTGQKI